MDLDWIYFILLKPPVLKGALLYYKATLIKLDNRHYDTY